MNDRFMITSLICLIPIHSRLSLGKGSKFEVTYKEGKMVGADDEGEEEEEEEDDEDDEEEDEEGDSDVEEKSEDEEEDKSN